MVLNLKRNFQIKTNLLTVYFHSNNPILMSFFLKIKIRAATEIRSLNCIATNSKMSFYVSQRLTGSYLHCHKKSECC